MLSPTSPIRFVLPLWLKPRRLSRTAEFQSFAAMEVEYARYFKEQRQTLCSLIHRFDPGISAGSDFHGQEISDTLSHYFHMEIAGALLARQRRAYENAASHRQPSAGTQSGRQK